MSRDLHHILATRTIDEGQTMSQTRPCNLCGKEIEFVRTPAGRAMPVDVGSKVVLVDDEGCVRTGRTPHWATCSDPEAARVRKQRLG